MPMILLPLAAASASAFGGGALITQGLVGLIGPSVLKKGKR